MNKLNTSILQKITDDLPSVVPSGWKCSLEMRNSSTLFLNVMELPESWEFAETVRSYYISNGFVTLVPETRQVFRDAEHRRILSDIWVVLNGGKPASASYMDVGWRPAIHFGSFGNQLIRT